MPSVTDRIRVAESRRRFADTFELWNRKVHFYLGLYFLFFLWLFAFTGLLLNHSGWRFQQFWPNRKISTFERQIQPPPSGSDLEQARDLMRQLGIQGEIAMPITRPAPDRLEFRANRPGHMSDVKADLKQGRATVGITNINFWGIIRVLHTFTGVRAADPGKERNWVLTTVWALSMDAVAAGLIVMVFGSLYMWWGLKRKRKLGMVALGLGIAVCGFFLFGLRWLYS